MSTRPVLGPTWWYSEQIQPTSLGRKIVFFSFLNKFGFFYRICRLNQPILRSNSKDCKQRGRSKRGSEREVGSSRFGSSNPSGSSKSHTLKPLQCSIVTGVHNLPYQVSSSFYLCSQSCADDPVEKLTWNIVSLQPNQLFNLADHELAQLLQPAQEEELEYHFQ